MKEKVKEIEAILKVSGVAAYLPEEVKDKVCHGVAIDLANHLFLKGEKPPVLSKEIDCILATLRHRIEVEDADWHYDATRDAFNQMLHLIEPYIKQEGQRVADRIRPFLKEPSLYHYVCWGGGTVLLEDKWGSEPTHKCTAYNGHYNCGCLKGCQREGGIINGDLELQDYERQQNSIIREILESLK